MLSLLLVSKGVVPYTKFQLRILITLKKLRPRILIGSKTTGRNKTQQNMCELQECTFELHSFCMFSRHVRTHAGDVSVCFLLCMEHCESFSSWKLSCANVAPNAEGMTRENRETVCLVWRKTDMSLFQNMETQCLFLTIPFQTAKHLVTRCTTDVTKLLFSRNKVPILSVIIGKCCA